MASIDLMTISFRVGASACPNRRGVLSKEMLDVRSRFLCAADRILSRDGIQALTQMRISGGGRRPAESPDVLFFDVFASASGCV